MALVAIVALLGEILVIMLPGVPFTSGERLIQFFVCADPSLAILGLMLLMIPALMVWRVWSVPYLPRKNDSLAGVVSYVAGSGLIRDCEDLDARSTEERNATLMGMEKTWRYGKSEGTDGTRRWLVDEDVGG